MSRSSAKRWCLPARVPRNEPPGRGSRWPLALIAGLLSSGPLLGQFGPQTDPAVERCLAEGESVKKIRTLGGVTRPELYRLECDGRSREAVFKSLDEFQRGVTRFDEGGWEGNFSDSYRYERAAYLLDRELGLNRVPVAVIRRVKRNDGALIDWIENASHEGAPKNPPTPRQMATLAPQKAEMRIFDALIYNVDRSSSNWLVGDVDWKLFLIDHPRSFRELEELPKAFLEERAWLSRQLHDRLRELTEARLNERLDGILSRGQIRSLLARRDRILEKIAEDVEKYGAAVVFQD